MPYYTGTKTVLTLRKYIDGQPTDDTKANSPSDPDYIPPFEDTSACPIEAYTTTTTTSTTTTTTTAAPTSSLTIWRSTTGGGNNPPTGWATSSLACSSAANATTVYFNQNVTGWDDAINNNLVVYQDSGNNAPYQGGNTYFRTEQTPNTGKSFLLSNSGVISTPFVCTTTTTTTTTTAAPSNCYAHMLYYDASTTCPFSNQSEYFTDNSTFCSATKIYTSSANCGSTNYAPNGYYKDVGNNVRYWNGQSFNSCTVCSVNP